MTIIIGIEIADNQSMNKKLYGGIMCDFFSPGMYSFLKYLVFFFIVMLIVSLFELPDWIQRKLGRHSKSDLENKVSELQKRIDELEAKIKKDE
jgi:hypothetical protein